MPAVYLAGPISGLTFAGCTDWREHALLKLLEHNIRGWSPMRAKEALASMESISGHGGEYSHMGPFATPQGVMARDRFDCHRADVVLVNFVGAKTVSIGTVMEIAWANQKHTPVVVAADSYVAGMSSEDRSWLAALIDGEGCVSVSVRDGVHGKGYYARVTLKMTHEGMVRRAHKIAGVGSVSGPKLQNVQNRKPYWTWTVMSNEAAALLGDLYPRLIIKAPQAAIASALQEMNVASGRLSKAHPEQARRDELYAAFIAAQRGASGHAGVPAPKVRTSFFEHMMLSQATDFKVATLDEAINVAIAILS